VVKYKSWSLDLGASATLERKGVHLEGGTTTKLFSFFSSVHFSCSQNSRSWVKVNPNWTKEFLFLTQFLKS